MSASGKQPTRNMAEAACQTMRDLLEQTDVVISDRHAESLRQFSALADHDAHYRQYGEIARSVANLLQDKSGQFIDQGTFIQILAVAPAFIDALSAFEDRFEIQFNNTLVHPVPPSSDRLSDTCLVLTDNDAFFQLFSANLRANGFVASRIESLASLLEIGLQTQPAAIIGDLKLMADRPAATDLLTRLQHASDLPPHLIVLGDPRDFSARLFAVRLGATRFFPNPPDIHRMVAVLKGVTAKTPIKPYRVFMVDDDRTMAPIYAKALTKAGMITTLSNDPINAMQAIADFSPDLIITDLLMSSCNGLEFISVIRQDDSLLDTPILLLTSDMDQKRHIEALSLGAEACMSKPVSLPLFIASVSAQAKKSRRLKRSRRDLHDFFARMRNGEIANDRKPLADELRLVQDELIAPEMIPPSDYIVREHDTDAVASSGQA